MRTPRAVVTGGAGFLGSHLCERLLARGVRGGLPRQLPRPVAGNVAHLLDRARASGWSGPTSPTTSTSRARSTGAALRLARLADRLPAAADRDAQGRLDRHAARARAGQGEGRPLPARVDVRGVRRPAGAPAAGDVLGPRQPGRPARGLRRGQAVRRGADDGLPPDPRRRHRHRAHLQHLRPADAPRRRPRHPDVHPPGAARASRSRSPATARRPGRSATSTTSSRASSGCCAPTSRAR